MILKQKKVKLILAPNVMYMIKEMCKMRPKNEWSGLISWRLSAEDGISKITVFDIFMMEYNGNPTFTSFSTSGKEGELFTKHISSVYDKYMEIDDNGNVLPYYVGLLHSHNEMPCRHSSTDDNTMIEQTLSKDTNNFLSIIVYNTMKNFDCRVSQRAKKVSDNTITKVLSETKWHEIFRKREETILGKEYAEIIDIPESDIVYSEGEISEEEKKLFEERVAYLKTKEENIVSIRKSCNNNSTNTGRYRGGEDFYSYCRKKYGYSDFESDDSIVPTKFDVLENIELSSSNRKYEILKIVYRLINLSPVYQSIEVDEFIIRSSISRYEWRASNIPYSIAQLVKISLYSVIAGLMQEYNYKEIKLAINLLAGNFEAKKYTRQLSDLASKVLKELSERNKNKNKNKNK